MSTTAESIESIQMDSKQLESIKNLIDSRIDNKLKEIEENKIPSMSLIATKGTLDWAYPPFILGSTAAALGWDVKIFFTFYGLLLLKKDLSLEVSGLGNPAMPMKMPFGPQWFQNIEWPMPNLIMASIPGFEKVATGLMKKTFSNKGVASIEELRSLSVEAEVEFIACQMTVDVFGFDQSEFIDDVKDYVGAASFLPIAAKSDVSMFM